MGRYTAAVEALGRARRLQPASIVNDTLLADLLVRAGDHAGGIEAATRARTRFATQRSSDDPSAPNTAAVAEALIADAEGRWEEAEAYWRKALDLVTLAFSTPSIRSVELGASEDVTRARLRARVAEALRRQGRVLEAEIFAREALQAMLGVFGASNIETVEVVNELALAILDQGRAADAELLARAALARLDAMGAPADAPIRAPSRLTLVRSLLPRRQWAHAGRELVALRAGLGDNRALFDRGLALDPDVPLTLLQSGQVDEALALASAGHQALAATQGPTALETAQMQAVLALALGAKGRVAEALAAFREALPVLLARETQPSAPSRPGRAPTGGSRSSSRATWPSWPGAPGPRWSDRPGSTPPPRRFALPTWRGPAPSSARSPPTPSAPPRAHRSWPIWSGGSRTRTRSPSPCSARWPTPRSRGWRTRTPTASPGPRIRSRKRRRRASSRSPT